MAIGAAGTWVYSGSVDSYIAANPHYGSDFFHVPAPSDDVVAQASQGTALILAGMAIVVVASLVAVGRARPKWLLLGALIAAVFPVLLFESGLRGMFQLMVNTICGDCTPPAPSPPWDAFNRGAVTIGAWVLVGWALAVVFLVLAVLRRSGGRLQPAPPMSGEPPGAITSRAVADQ